jgi:rare lipoprotein A (peptidoglycan hydrolase)
LSNKDTGGKIAAPKASEDASKRSTEVVLFYDYRVKIGDKIYSLESGEILNSPSKPFLRLSTKRFSEARFLIRDPEALEYTRISESDEVSVELRCGSGIAISKFIGKIKEKGRLEPSATIIHAIDNLSALNRSSGSGLTDSSEPLSGQGAKPDAPGGIPSSTTTGQLVSLKRKNGDRTAEKTIYQDSIPLLAHPSLPFGTQVNVENIKTKKILKARVGDRSLSGKGFEASSQLLKDLGFVLPGDNQCRFEVLTQGIVQTPKVEKTSESKGISETQRLNTAEGTKLKYSKQTPYSTDRNGLAYLQSTPGKALAVDAANRGDSIIGSGNTIIEVSALQSTQKSSGLILDYTSGRDKFKDDPIFIKRTPLQVNSGTGTISVQGWNSVAKQEISATVVSPGNPDAGVETKQFATPIGKLDIKAPIYPGSLYTWGDATKNGLRIPPTKLILNNIITIAQIVDKYTVEWNKGKWTITSWYRDPESNRKGGGKTNSSHLEGLAIDAVFPNYMDLHKKLFSSWPGGLAYKSGPQGFFHIDARYSPAKRRWPYPS